MVCPTRFELATYRVGVCHSIQLSYGHGYGLKQGREWAKISFFVYKAGFVCYNIMNYFVPAETDFACVLYQILLAK